MSYSLRCHLWQETSLVALAEGVRFETPTDQENIGPDLTSSVRSQSLADGIKKEENPIKPIGHDSFSTV